MTGHMHRIIVTATALLALAPGAPRASDFRDAPTASLYGALDIEALYLFRNPNDPSRLVVALTVDAAADPLFGPTYHFQSNGLYRIYFTTRTDAKGAKPTAQIDIAFSPFGNGSGCPAPALPCQAYRAVFPGGIIVDGLTTQGTDQPVHLPPNINNAATTHGLIKAFAGPREDPVFFDRVGFGRALSVGRASMFTGVDAFAGKNAAAIVLEFPVTMVFPTASCQASVPNSPCGAWAVTYRRERDFDHLFLREHLDAEDAVQLDRFGNPLVTLALIPAVQKDAFNASQPPGDALNWSPVILAQLLALDKAFGTCTGAATSAGSCNPNAPLLAAVFVPDILPFSSTQPDGYPNGRLPSDHVTDLLLSLILNIPGFKDGTNAKHYCLPSPEFPSQPAMFPYLGPPLQLGAGPNPTVTPQSCP